MDNKLYMENYLLILKSTVEVYVHGTLESSNNEVRNLLKENLNEILTSQSDTYTKMTSYGWYTVNNINSSEIIKTLNKIQNIN